MKEQIRTEKITFWNIVVRIFQGTVLGLASLVPFFQVKDLKETLQFREDRFSNNVDILQRLWWLLKHRWSYILGVLIGVYVFFYIPCMNLMTDYPAAIYSGLLALSLPFLALEIYRFIKDRKNTTHWIATGIIVCILCIGVPVWYHFGKAASMLPDYFTTWPGLVYVALLFAAGTFLTCFSGASLGTVLFFSATMISMSKAANIFLYEHTNLMIVYMMVVGGLFGYLGFVTFNYFFPKLHMEKHATNICIYTLAILLILIYDTKSMTFTDVTTELAQKITLISTILACLFAGVGLTIHGYKFLNKEDYEVTNETFKDYKRL